MRIAFKFICRYLPALTIVFSLFPAQAWAAVEYLRVQGVVSSSYGQSHPGYDASYGFQPGQMVYFDFAFDTSAESAGRSDSGFQDYFFADFLQGSVSGNGDHYGVTTMFPEGMTTTLFMRNNLSFGGAFEDHNGWDKRIETWIVGTELSLLSNGYDNDAIIGALTVTYRASSPPAPVPVPAAVWLLASTLAGLASIARR